jgi:flagellar hook-associated protein 3 FlgL
VKLPGPAPHTNRTIAAAVTYTGDSGQIKYQVSSGTTSQVNIPGDSVFKPVFDALISLRDDLQSGDIAAISDSDLKKIDDASDNLLSWQAEVGARTNQLENTSQRLDDLKTNFTKLLSDNEDVDVAATIMDLKMQQNVYQAALSTGASMPFNKATVSGLTCPSTSSPRNSTSTRSMRP